ncbi:MAG: PIG-L deacetylase family protein [Candidatus Marinimicrobia bacterium]|nr:PIG-L deacetylase family protein [Candidatus Neomarinimicrobiota bacterium]
MTTASIKKMNILAIGAHPDDIEIGCGGTLAKYASYGHNIFMFIATDGNAGGIGKIRKKEQVNAAKILNVKDIFWGGYIDTEMEVHKEAIMKVEDIINKTQPDSIFINYSDDTHQDHRHIAAITNSATRYIRNVLLYETPTTQNFQPNVFVDIGRQFLDIKMESLKAHESQIDKTNIMGVSILELAQSAAHFRGVQARVAFAEAFQSLRLFINI